MARIQINANRVANADKKEKAKNKWRKKKTIYANMSGRIMLKDLKGKSYM